MTYYERALPHWQPEDAAIFLTWRLQGSLPKEYFASRRDPDSAREFLRQDRILDKALLGPTWLKDDRVAARVAAALHHADATLKLYDLRAWVIMSNDVHLFIDPHAPDSCRWDLKTELDASAVGRSGRFSTVLLDFNSAAILAATTGIPSMRIIVHAL